MFPVSCKMDFNSEHYYKINRIILSAIGLWPHRHITLRQIQAALLSFLLISVTFPQLTKLIVEEYNVDVVVRVLSSTLPFLLFIVKYIAFYFVTEDIKGLMQYIQNDWNALKDNNEHEIIHQYAKASVLITKSLASK
ncbi:uncharacterized protein LOC112589780 [Harpegnathos saltator]|uniref:uncharacterized protein LOC112589780 n=1 Tax=Harpegnathos saltator TaxID=610380 RepID=UPI000DBEDDC5|nr:uncharacterized protein LOC112589780 [Harpegnathos saltator]